MCIGSSLRDSTEGPGKTTDASQSYWDPERSHIGDPNNPRSVQLSVLDRRWKLGPNGEVFVGAPTTWRNRRGRMDLADATGALDPLAMLRAQRRQRQVKEFPLGVLQGGTDTVNETA